MAPGVVVAIVVMASSTGRTKGTVRTWMVMASMNIPITRRMTLRRMINSNFPKPAAISSAATIWGTPRKFRTLE